MSTTLVIENYELARTASRLRDTSPADSHRRQPHDAAEAALAPATVPQPQPKLTDRKTIVAIVSVVFSTILSSFTSGLLIVEMPAIARDTGLDASLLLWPQTVVSLVSACTLLICGSLADVFGSKRMYLAGSITQAVFILGFGLAQTSAQIITFRAFQGLAQSMFLPSSVSIVISTFPAGPARNMAFATMGGGQPLGFSMGLVLGGVFADTVGWRASMYFGAAFAAAVSVLAAFGLEETRYDASTPVLTRLAHDIDWTGAAIISSSLALFCYVLATLTNDPTALSSPTNITLLTLSLLLIPLFALWQHHQSRALKPCLIPNTLWRNRVFASVCLGVFCTWGAFHAFELILSLWLQLVQRNSALQTSLRLLPESIVGLLVNALTGLFVHRIPTAWIVHGAVGMSLVAPLLMALSEPEWVYWAAGFPAICLIVVGPDVLYTISNLVISSQFPESRQGLAGAVFNTVAQVGKGVGLALSGLIASAVMMQQGAGTSEEEEDAAAALTKGYKATFWFCLGMNVLTILLCVWGLRKVGRVGAKQD